MARKALGTISSRLSCCASTASISRRGSRTVSSSRMQVHAPTSGAARNCQIAMSKATEAVCATRSAALRPTVGTLPSMLLSMPRCSMATPLGWPVEPEV